MDSPTTPSDASPGEAIAAAGATTPSAATGELRAGTLGLRHAVVISVAVMSPAASIFFNVQPQIPLAGAAIPFCYLLGFLVALLVANQYSEFARELPSAGSAYTYVTEGLGPRWGFFVGWLGLIAIALGVPYTFSIMSANLELLVRQWFGPDIPWPVYFVVALAFIFALAVIGVKQSVRVDITFLVFEIGICLVLAVLLLVGAANAGTLTTAPLLPTAAPPGDGLAVGVVLAVLSFIGFETAAALGEETREPRKSIPRAVYGSMLVVGVFYLVMVYAATVGYGPASLNRISSDSFPIFDVLARRAGGGVLAALIDLAGLLSLLGAALAIVNGGARILYAVARDGLLPRPFGWMHPTRATPAGAITILCALGLGSGLALGLTLTTGTTYTLLGTLDALFILLIYALVSLACMRFFWRKRRAQFRLVRHGVVPALGLLIALGIAVLAIASPGAGALAFIPVVVGGWLLLGLIVLFGVLRGKVA